MNQERKQIPFRAKVAAILALAPAALWAACGGKGETSNSPSESPTIGPSPERTIEPTLNPTAIASPTVRPPEPTPTATTAETPTIVPTPELLPTTQEVFDLISTGLSETPVGPEQIPKVEYTDLNALQFYISQCNSDRKPVSPFITGETFTPDDPNYGSYVNTVCMKVAGATGELYKVTGNGTFFQANQQMKKIHKAVIDSLSSDFPDLAQHWPSIVSRYYTLSQ